MKKKTMNMLLVLAVKLFFGTEMCLARGVHASARVQGTTPWHVDLGFWMLIVGLALLLIAKIIGGLGKK